MGHGVGLLDVRADAPCTSLRVLKTLRMVQNILASAVARRGDLRVRKMSPHLEVVSFGWAVGDGRAIAALLLSCSA